MAAGGRVARLHSGKLRIHAAGVRSTWQPARIFDEARDPLPCHFSGNGRAFFGPACRDRRVPLPVAPVHPPIARVPACDHDLRFAGAAGATAAETRQLPARGSGLRTSACRRGPGCLELFQSIGCPQIGDALHAGHRDISGAVPVLVVRDKHSLPAAKSAAGPVEPGPCDGAGFRRIVRPVADERRSRN